MKRQEQRLQRQKEKQFTGNERRRSEGRMAG